MKEKILHAAFFTPGRGRWGLPLLVEGEPGVAKTAVIEQFAARYSIPCEVLSPGERGEGAFGVVPVPLTRNGVTYLTYPTPDWAEKFANSNSVDRPGLQRLGKPTAGLVFVDEVTTAAPALQPPLLGLIGAGKLGGMTFGPRVRIMGACNPVDQAANGYDLPAPLANRFGHMRWASPTVDQHAAYMMGVAGADDAGTADCDVEEAHVMRLWPDAYARAVGLETGFLQSHPDMKNRCPKAGDPQTSRAWPSDRSWEMAVRALAAAEIHGLSAADTDEYVAAFIGAVAYEAFGTFVEQADLPRPADVLDGKVKFAWEPRRLDRSAAIIAACTALVVPADAKLRVERSERLWGMLGSATAYDIIVPAAQAMTKAQLHVSKAAMPVLAKIAPTLKAAGITAGQQF